MSDSQKVLANNKPKAKCGKCGKEFNPDPGIHRWFVGIIGPDEQRIGGIVCDECAESWDKPVPGISATFRYDKP
jgi:hypothetical protein